MATTAASSNTASSVRVLGAPHTGITVRSLAEAEYVFHDILNLPVQRHSHIVPPVAGIVGAAGADIHTAMLELPGGHLLELLEYAEPRSEAEMRPLSWEVGSWHLALTVESIQGTADALTGATLGGRNLGWKMLAEPQALQAGPNTGMKICYMRDSHGTTLELFEPPKKE